MSTYTPANRLRNKSSDLPRSNPQELIVELLRQPTHVCLLVLPCPQAAVCIAQRHARRVLGDELQEGVLAALEVAQGQDAEGGAVPGADARDEVGAFGLGGGEVGEVRFGELEGDLYRLGAW